MHWAEFLRGDLFQVQSAVLDPFRQRPPHVRVEPVDDLVDGERGEKALPVVFLAAETDNGRAGGQQPLLLKMVQGRNQLAPGKVAGAAEDEDHLGDGFRHQLPASWSVRI
jgi:hypothetical protein